MASPKAAQSITSRQPPLPGQGKNVALEALQQAADRDLQRQSITAGLQAEAMKATTAAAEMKVAAAHDISQGITEAGEAFATQMTIKKQREVDAAEKEKQRRHEKRLAAQAQFAAMARKKVTNEANFLNTQADRRAAETARLANQDEGRSIAVAGKLEADNRRLLDELGSGVGFPEDPKELDTYIERLKTSLHHNNDKLNETSLGIATSQMKNSISMAIAKGLATSRKASTKVNEAKRRDTASKNRERDLHVKDAALPHATRRFENQQGYKIIDSNFDTGQSVQDTIYQIKKHLGTVDMSNPAGGPGGAPGMGIITASAENSRAVAAGQGQPGALNRALGKLGPLGLAAVEGYQAAIEGYPVHLGETDDPKRAAFRAAVHMGLLQDGAQLYNLPSSYAIYQGEAHDIAADFFDNYREKHGQPPSEQKIWNHMRGINLDFIPDNMIFKNVFKGPADFQTMGTKGMSVESMQTAPITSKTSASSAEALAPERVKSYGFDPPEGNAMGGFKKDVIEPLGSIFSQTDPKELARRKAEEKKKALERARKGKIDVLMGRN